MTVDRYHAFAGKQHYPRSGKGDYQGSFDSYADAKEFIDDDLALDNFDWVCILWDDGYKMHELSYWLDDQS